MSGHQEIENSQKTWKISQFFSKWNFLKIVKKIEILKIFQKFSNFEWVNKNSTLGQQRVNSKSKNRRFQSKSKVDLGFLYTLKRRLQKLKFKIESSLQRTTSTYSAQAHTQ